MELLLVTLSPRVVPDVSELLLSSDALLNELLDDQVSYLLEQSVVVVLN